MSKILVLANHYNTLRIFRRELLIRLCREGHTVIVSIPECDDENKRILLSYGCSLIFTPMDRRGMNPLEDGLLLIRYVNLVREIRPDKIISYTIKPNVYGSLAARRTGISHYANITGLGSAFQKEGPARKLVSALYKFSLRKADKVFFENRGNRNTLVRAGIVRADQAVVMHGAGVNLREFAPAEYPGQEQGIRFLFIGRIMAEKGVDELFAAMRRIRKEFPDTSFDFIGWYEDRYQETVEAMEKEGLLGFHGFVNDVRPFIENAHCIIHPSWHEGMSNSLLEAAAMCRPLITSDIHGCKEAVKEGVNGYLTRVRDADSIYQKMRRFILLPFGEKKKMGRAGRRRMEKYFDKDMVVDKTIREIGL